MSNVQTAILQIIKVNEARTGSKDGRAWEMQDAECILLDDQGQPSQVGVLSIPKDLRGKVTAGIYTGSFTLKPDLRTRKIEAVLVSLNPYTISRQRGVSQEAPK